MDSICGCRQYAKGQIRQINACRIYLQVLLLSNIATPCGKHVALNYHMGTRYKRANWPSIRYLRQQKPSTAAWKLWRKVLNLLYLQHDRKTLQTPLGAWYQWHPTNHQWESTFYGKILYQASEDSTNYRQLPINTVTHRNTKYTDPGNQVNAIPDNSQPVTAHSTPTGYVV
jgi:hypothetical protein